MERSRQASAASLTPSGRPTDRRLATSEFVRRSLRACLLNTTLRGPRRIVTCEVRLLSYFWAAVCLGSLLLLVAHFNQLVQDYLSYQTYMLQTEVLHDKSTLFPTEFPDVVICPHQMFSDAALQLWANGSVKSPWQQIRQYRERVGGHADKLLNLSETDLRILLDSFNYPATLGYYLNTLTDDEVRRLGRGNEVLIDCAVATNGRRRTRHNCPIRLTKIIHRKYLLCLQVTVDPSVSSSTQELSLFLDSGPRWDALGSDFTQHMVSFMQDYEQLGRGFTLWLKQTGRPFDALSKRVFLQPGRVNRVTFQERIEFKVQGPYPGTCSSDPDYSQPQCNMRRFVHQVQQLCSCNYFEESAHWHLDFPHCSELLRNLSRSLEQSKCVEQVEQNYGLMQLSDCPVSCKRHLYNMDVSSSEFDLPSWFLCWLQQPAFSSLNATPPIHLCLANPLLCPDYATSLIRFILPSINDTTATTEKLLANCNQSLFADVPLDQVASVVLYRSNEFPSILRQKFIVTPTLLFSQIGGASSLYLGLSLTFFAEIVDWLARLAMFLWAARARRGEGDGEEVVNKAMLPAREGENGAGAETVA